LIWNRSLKTPASKISTFQATCGNCAAAPKQIPEAEGVLESHPLRYAVRLLGCDFNGGQLTLPHVDLPEAPEGDDAAPEAEDPSAEPQTPESPQVERVRSEEIGC